MYLKLHFTTNLSGFDVNGICVFFNDNQSFHFLDDLTLQLCLQKCKDDGGHPYAGKEICRYYNEAQMEGATLRAGQCEDPCPGDRKKKHLEAIHTPTYFLPKVEKIYFINIL